MGDRCDGNINMKLNDEHAYTLIVDLRVRISRVCVRVALHVNTILRIRNFIIRPVVTSTSKTLVNMGKEVKTVFHQFTRAIKTIGMYINYNRMTSQRVNFIESLFLSCVSSCVK